MKSKNVCLLAKQMAFKTQFIVEVMYTFDCESDGGINFETQEEAEACFVKMFTSVPNDYGMKRGDIDYMSFYKAEGDVEEGLDLNFSHWIKNISTYEWNEDEWNSALANT